MVFVPEFGKHTGNLTLCNVMSHFLLIILTIFLGETSLLSFSQPRSQRTNDEEEQEGGRGDRNDRRRRQRTTSGINENEVDEQREEKVAMKDEKQENKR